MKKIILVINLCTTILFSCTESKAPRYIPKVNTYTYKPTWTSLSHHTIPYWAKNVKFGIYSHWSSNTVRAQDQNYDMPIDEALTKWTGEKFDAAKWAILFKRAGAQFAGPVAWHVDGILNWASNITPYNSVKVGPHRDVVGELAQEIRRRNMKFLCSFHSTTLWGSRGKNDKVKIPADFYNQDTGDNPLIYNETGRFNNAYLQGWLDRMLEAILKYHPDMVWVDTNFGGSVGPELRHELIEGRLVSDTIEVNGIRDDIQRKLLATYFNHAAKRGQEPCFVYKSFDIPPSICMRDIENGVLPGLAFDPWMADINMMYHNGWKVQWFYSDDKKLKDANCLIDMMVDIVSKNGRMLLNVPPKIDGTFSKEEKKVLYEIGDWLKLNGEAIYGTIPWTMYGEGPSLIGNPGHHGQGYKKAYLMPKYTVQDIRFTQKDKFLYAIVLDWPVQKLLIKSLGYKKKLYKGEIKSISLIGSDCVLSWEQGPYELRVQFPKQKVGKHAYVLKIELQDL